MTIFLTALASIVMSVAAQFCLKAGMSSAAVKEALLQPFGPTVLFNVLTNQFVFGGFVLYGLGAIVWLKVLATWDVSKAYPLVGLGFVLTMFVGLFMGEQISGWRIFGILLISVGVWAVARS